MFDLSSIQKSIEMKERYKYLDMHPYDIWHGKDGKYHTYLPDKEKGRVPRKRNTLKEIEDVVADYWKEQETNPTIEEIFNLWADEKLQYKEIGKGTYDRYKRDYDHLFSETSLSKCRIKNVVEDDLERFIRKTIAEKELTQKAYSNMRTLVIGIFKYAKKHKFTEISISYFIKDLDISRRVFKKTVKDKEGEVFSEEEVKMVIHHLRNNQTIEHLGLLLAFQTGVRVGELSTLKFSDIIGKSIHVQRTEVKYQDEVTNKNIRVVKEFPKSDAGDRYIVINESALDTIAKIKAKNPTGVYMLEKDGKRIIESVYNDRIYRICDVLGIRRRSMHKIRKTYGTMLIDGNVDESIIMEQMGHADITTTKKYYYFSNKSREHKEEQIAKAVTV